MKTKSYLIGLLLLAAGLFMWSHQTSADNTHRSKPAFVELLYERNWVNGVAQASTVYSATGFGDETPNVHGLTVGEADVLLIMAGFEPEAPAIYGQRIYRRR